MYRTRKNTKAYKPASQKKKLEAGIKACPFCNPKAREIVEQGKFSYVTKNTYGYQYWEFMGVADHLMIVPKRHVEGLSDLNSAERNEIMDTISRFEAKGYNVYAREKNNPVKSVPHQHTHLLKTDNRLARFAVYFKKPYLLITR